MVQDVYLFLCQAVLLLLLLPLATALNNEPNSVFLTTGQDFATNVAVVSGSIGSRSFDGPSSCPYGMSWDNSGNSCSVCQPGFICNNFASCTSCVSCPSGLSIDYSYKSGGSTPINSVYYACTQSSNKTCPAGSGKVNTNKQGCAICIADQYNDGSFETCQQCPSGTFPNYQVKRIPGCDALNQKNCFVLQRAAASCSAQCPEGTGEYEKTFTVQSAQSGFEMTSLASTSYEGNRIMLKLIATIGSGWNQILPPYFDGNSGTTLRSDGCLPCTVFRVRSGNKCAACNSGASDRANLNSLGDSLMFASRCIPDICPWPYVVMGDYLVNDRLASGNDFDNPSIWFPSKSPRSSTVVSIFCNQVHLGGTVAVIAIIAVVLLGTYVVAVLFAAVGQDEALSSSRRRKLIVGMLLTTMSPAIDFVSDLMYIVSTLFYNDIVCIVTCAFFLLPMFFFWRMLVKHGVHFSFYIGRPPAFAVMEKYDSIPKALMGLAGYLPLYIINLPVFLPLFLVGHVLYCCKVFPVARVSNLWLKLYSRSNKHASNVVIILPLLQESIFEEMLTESVPQMVIQIINNTLTNVWSPLSYFSTAMSAVMILNGIWRLVYYRLYLKIAINEIPNDLSAEIFKLSSVEEGDESLARLMNARVVPQVELSAIVSAITDGDEFTPLIQRHISVATQALRAEIASEKSQTTTQLSALRSDIEEIKAQIQELKTRSSSN